MGKQVLTPSPGTGTDPGVIPTSQVIVLKEHELDCDLATAIRRIREREETSHSRILVVAPDDEVAEASLAKERPVPAIAPTTLGQVARRAGEAAVQEVGRQLAPLADGLQHYLAEMRQATEALASSELDPKSAAQLVATAIEWTEALSEDLGERVASARAGFQTVDARELMLDMAMQVEASYPEVRVNVAMAEPRVCRAVPAALAEAFFLGLVLVAHRIGSVGSVGVEVESSEDSIAFRFLGNGEPKQLNAPEAVKRFRHLVVDVHGGRVHHDGLGPMGCGLAIHLPV